VIAVCTSFVSRTALYVAACWAVLLECTLAKGTDTLAGRPLRLLAILMILGGSLQPGCSFVGVDWHGTRFGCVIDGGEVIAPVWVPVWRQESVTSSRGSVGGMACVHVYEHTHNQGKRMVSGCLLTVMLPLGKVLLELVRYYRVMSHDGMPCVPKLSAMQIVMLLSLYNCSPLAVCAVALARLIGVRGAACTCAITDGGTLTCAWHGVPAGGARTLFSAV
jgi:hypothetical protein